MRKGRAGLGRRLRVGWFCNGKREGMACWDYLSTGNMVGPTSFWFFGLGGRHTCGRYYRYKGSIIAADSMERRDGSTGLVAKELGNTNG
jgi:hypothetical protein